MDPAREAFWQEKLSPIRVGAEPVEAQLALRFSARVVITALSMLIGLIILAIFGAFGRPDVGLGLLGACFLPATLWFWLDYAVLRRRVSTYLRERAEASEAPPG